MKRSSLFTSGVFVTGLSLLAIMSACTVKSSSSPDAAPAAPVTPTVDPVAANAVPGPNLTGRWKSDCAPTPDGKFVRLTYEFKAKQVVDRRQDIYDSAKCDHLTDFMEGIGTYSFTAKFGDSTYDLAFSLPTADGYDKFNENLLYSASALTVSFRSDGSGVKPNIPLIAVDANDKPIPQPTPTPAPGATPTPTPAPTLASVCTHGDTTSQIAAVNFAYLQGFDNCSGTSSKQMTSDSADSEKWKVGIQCDQGNGIVDVSLKAGTDGRCVMSSAQLEN